MRGLKMAGFLAASATITFVAGGLVFIENANARLQPAAPAIQQGPCATPDHRAFDFWVGQWVVYDPQGDVVGRNTLELKLYGCTLHESWESASGPTGNGHSIRFLTLRRASGIKPGSTPAARPSTWRAAGTARRWS